MNPDNLFNHFHLKLSDGKITSIIDVLTGAELKSFYQSIARKGVSKLYIIKDGPLFLYVGTTTGPIGTRLNSGLSANGKRGYHGYKWKHHALVSLYVWCFVELHKLQVEAIEAEVVYLIRKKAGQWPLFQNEIHFNNDFKQGILYARQIYSELLDTTSVPDIKHLQAVHDIFENRPEAWGLRGDSFLWQELYDHYLTFGLPYNKDEFFDSLNSQFIRVTGKKPSAGANYHVPDYDAGGMSSGQVSGDFWLQKGFSILIARYEAQRSGFF